MKCEDRWGPPLYLRTLWRYTNAVIIIIIYHLLFVIHAVSIIWFCVSMNHLVGLGKRNFPSPTALTSEALSWKVTWQVTGTTILPSQQSDRNNVWPCTVWLTSQFSRSISPQQLSRRTITNDFSGCVTCRCNRSEVPRPRSPAISCANNNLFL